MLFTSWLVYQVVKATDMVLSAPLIAPYKGLTFILDQIKEEVDRDLLDDEQVKSQLAQLQLRYELAEEGLAEEEYLKLEEELLERLSAIREHQKDEEPEPDAAWWARTFEKRQ